MRDTERVYRQIDFPPLTEEQKKEIEKLEAMKDEEIDTKDIPEVDFSDANFFYAVRVPKAPAETGQCQPLGQDAQLPDVSPSTCI